MTVLRGCRVHKHVCPGSERHQTRRPSQAEHRWGAFAQMLFRPEETVQSFHISQILWSWGRTAFIRNLMKSNSLGPRGFFCLKYNIQIGGIWMLPLCWWSSIRLCFSVTGGVSAQPKETLNKSFLTHTLHFPECNQQQPFFIFLDCNVLCTNLGHNFNTHALTSPVYRSLMFAVNIPANKCLSTLGIQIELQSGPMFTLKHFLDYQHLLKGKYAKHFSDPQRKAWNEVFILIGWSVPAVTQGCNVGASAARQELCSYLHVPEAQLL